MNELVRRWRAAAAALAEGNDEECTATVRDWIEEWDRRFWASDFSGFEEIYASRFRGESRVPMIGEHVYRGPEGFADMREELSEVTSRFWFDIREVKRAEDGLFAGIGRMRARGRYSGLLMQSPWAVVWRVQDAMLLEATAYIGHRKALARLARQHS